MKYDAFNLGFWRIEIFGDGDVIIHFLCDCVSGLRDFKGYPSVKMCQDHIDMVVRIAFPKS